MPRTSRTPPRAARAGFALLGCLAAPVFPAAAQVALAPPEGSTEAVLPEVTVTGTRAARGGGR